MRELKFKVRWDTDWIIFDFQSVARNLFSWRELACKAIQDGKPIYQYIGIKDKNGKEIYEGDIVKMWWGWSGNKDIYQYHSISLSIGEVGPCKSESVMEWKLSGCYNEWDGKDVEVVGNIYENPDMEIEKD